MKIKEVEAEYMSKGKQPILDKRTCKKCGGFIPITESGKFGNYCRCVVIK